MAQSSAFDPVAAWQQMVGQWERQVNELSTKLSGSEQFAGPMNQAAKLSFAAQRSFEDSAEKMAQAMQLATRSQVQGVLERLDRIEERLDAIAAALVPATSGAARADEPKRTRKPQEPAA